MSSWHRVVEADGSTVCYTPDEATAKEHAAAPDLADACHALIYGDLQTAIDLARAALKKSGRIS